MKEITPLQKQVLVFFQKSPLSKKFYWTGGTVLSVFYLHHRKSKNLDFFSDFPINYNEIIKFIRAIKKQLKLKKLQEKKIFDRWEFILKNKEELRLEFVHYEHPKLKPRRKWKGIYIDSLDDLAANKVMAFFDRNDPKDLVDLYFLLTKKGYKINRLLKLVEKKFGVRLEESSVWSEAFKSLENLDELKPLIIGRPKETEETLKKIKDYFISHSQKYLKKYLE